MKNPFKHKYGAVFLALLGAILFSSKAVMVKLAYNYPVDKLTLLGLRMGFALPIYLFLAFNQPRHGYNEKLKAKDWLLLVGLGVMGYYFASFLDFWGLEYVGASLERLILFIYPTLTTILAAIVFKRKVKGKTLLAILLSYIGIIVALSNNILIKSEKEFWLGALLIFGSALTFSFYLVGSEKLIPKFGSKRFTTYCMIISCVAVLIHLAFHPNLNFGDLPWQVYVLGICIAIFNTVLPSFLISEAIKEIGSSKTATLSSVGPISVIILAAIFLNEPITWAKVIGTAIVILGVFLISKTK